MKRLAFLLIINLCNAIDNINVRQILFNAALQTLTPEIEQQIQSVKTKQAIIGITKHKHESSKHKVNKMYIPNTKPNVCYRRQSRSKD